jgi:membrane associated rhomboid family serine protease
MANCIRCGRQLPPLTFGKKICQWCVQHEAAQRGESDEATQRVIPAPWVRRSQPIFSLTQILFGACIVVFIVMLALSDNPLAFLDPTHEFSPQISIRLGANYGPLTLSGEWWRLLTYMFLHGSLLHIGFNMWCLWDLGAMCESLYGRWTFASIYVITGVAGGIASIGWNPCVWSVGASGAIFGLAGALIASFYLGEFSLPRFAIKGTLRSLLFFAGFNLLFGSMFPGIDNSCHIGGLVTGLALGAVIARLAPHADAPFRRGTIVAMVALAVVAVAFGVRQWRGGTMRAQREFEESAADPIARGKILVREKPDLPQAHFVLAEAYYNQQQFAEAEAEFKRGIELQPSSAAGRYYLGMTYLGEKEFEKAKATFTEMLSLNNGSAYGHYGLGVVSANQQNYQGAVDEFKKAVAAGAPVSGLYYDLGNSYAKLMMYDDAIAAYLLENALADAYAAKGMSQQAQEARNRASELKGQTPQ